MSGMLQPNGAYRERVERHQAEARRWADVDRLGRIARANRPRPTSHAHRHHMLHASVRVLRVHLRAMLTPNNAHRHHRA